MIWMKYYDYEASLLVRPLDGRSEGKGIAMTVEKKGIADIDITLDESDALELVGYLWGKLNAAAGQVSEANPVNPLVETNFQIGQTVIHNGESRTVCDIDAGYDILALDGDKYISPGHPDNRCIEARMSECEINVLNHRTEARGSVGFMVGSVFSNH